MPKELTMEKLVDDLNEQTALESAFRATIEGELLMTPVANNLGFAIPKRGDSYYFFCLFCGYSVQPSDAVNASVFQMQLQHAKDVHQFQQRR